MCARYMGDSNKTVFIHESGTYANTSGAGVWLGLVQNHEPSESLQVEAYRCQGGNRAVQGYHDAGKIYEGTITYYPQDWRLLGFALGSIVDAGSPSPYTHTLKRADSADKWAYTSGAMNPFASFTIEDSRAATGTGLNSIRTYKGCTVEEWSMSWSQGQMLEASCSYVAQSMTMGSGASTAVTANALRPFTWRDVKVFLPSGTLIDTTHAGTLTVSNSLDKDTFYSNGSDVRQPCPPTDFGVTLELTKRSSSEWTKTLMETYAQGGSAFNMQIEVTDVSAGAGSRSSFFTLSGCRLDPYNQPSPLSGPMDDTLTITAKEVDVLVNDTIQLYAPW